MVVENFHWRFGLEVHPGGAREMVRFANVDRADVPQVVHNSASPSSKAGMSSQAGPNRDQPVCNDAGWGTVDGSGLEVPVQELVVLVDSSGWVFVP